MDEAVAYFLTLGYALVPREAPDLAIKGRMLIEGIATNNEPHMIAVVIDELADLSKVATREHIIHCKDIFSPGNLDLLVPQIYWYVLPCQINSNFNAQHAAIRSRWISTIQTSWGVS